MDILALLACLTPTMTQTTIRQLHHIAQALLTFTGRVTMTGLDRWSGPGGSYRTVQRWFATTIPWALVFWLFFRCHLWQPDDIYLLAGDEVVVTKAGKKTHGLDRFFSGVYQKVVPGVAFLAWRWSVPARAAPFPSGWNRSCVPRRRKPPARPKPPPPRPCPPPPSVHRVGPRAVGRRPRQRAPCRPSCSASRRCSRRNCSCSAGCCRWSTWPWMGILAIVQRCKRCAAVACIWCPSCGRMPPCTLPMTGRMRGAAPIANMGPNWTAPRSPRSICALRGVLQFALPNRVHLP